MIRKFVYASSSGTRERCVFVIKENDKYIGGLDLSVLSEEDCKRIDELYKDLVPMTDFNKKFMLEGFNPDWIKAYRQYSKSKIINS